MFEMMGNPQKKMQKASCLARHVILGGFREWDGVRSPAHKQPLVSRSLLFWAAVGQPWQAARL